MPVVVTMTYRDRDRVAEVIIVPDTEHTCGGQDAMYCIPCTADWLRELITEARRELG